MSDRLVVIGGDAAGMSAASQARRRQPYLDIVALERGRWTSYSACGIPYHVAGDVPNLEDLIARTPEEFRNQRIDVRLQHEVMAMDLDARTLEVRDHARQRTIQLPFDLLHVATGARPVRPDLPGIDLPHVLGVQTLGDAEALLAQARTMRCRHVTIVGGGYIGLEMAEAFQRWGAEVILVEGGREVMRTLDPDMGRVVASALRSFGVDVRTGTRMVGIEADQVTTDQGSHHADLVVLGLGVEPNSELAADAGIATGAKNAIVVDRQQQTSAEGVWAAGDCAESYHLVSERHLHIALGTVANKQGRVAGINIAGGYATFPGVVGTAITKICDTEVARTGLTEQEADRAGFACDVATIEATTRAGYFPKAEAMTVKMLAERGTGRVLGAQIVGGPGAAKRIDVVAMALHARADVQQLVDADLAYAPPFSSVWDPVQVAARQLFRAGGG